VKIPKISFDFDWSLVIIPFLLSVAGIATLYSITSVSGKTDLPIRQIIYFVVGAVIYLIFAFLDYRILKPYSWYLYFLGIIFLVLVEVFGQKIFGSRRWIDLGFFQFQPSELMKISILIFISSYFMESGEISARKILSFLFFLAIPIFIILREPDLGTALAILFSAFVVFIALRVPKKFFIGGAILVAIASPIIWTKLKPYQKERIVSFINPSSNPLTSGYNVNQAKIAVGSGGLLGKGLSGSTQSQLQFLPIAHIDFIFSGWAEATGFVGSSMLVIAFAILIWRIFAVANLSRENFGFIFCVGSAGLIFFQALVNIGMNVGIMPVTGIPLPFVSYGGTSFLVNSAILGIVQSIYLRRKALRFD